MKTIKTKLLLLSFLAAAFSLGAQQTDTASYNYSLQQCIDYALAHNTDVQNAMLDEVAAADKVKEVTGIALPQVNTSFQVQDYLEIPTSFIPGEFFGGPAGSYIPVKFGTKYNASLSFTGTQLIFSGPWIVGLQAAKVYQGLAQKNADRTSIEAAADVTKAYYTVLVNMEKKKLLDANIAAVKKLKDDTKAYLDNGFVEPIDYSRITVTYNNLSTEVTNAKNLLDLSLVLLKYQMGMDQSAKLSLTQSISDITFAPTTVASGKYDYSKRVEYQLMDMQLKGSILTMKAERMGYLPTVAFFGTATAQAQRTTFNIFTPGKPWYPVGVIGLQVSMPIFDGLQRHYRYSQDKIGMLKAQNNLLLMERTIDMQQAVAKVNLENSAASLSSQKENMDLAQQIVDAAKAKYDVGFQSNLEIINAETALKEAQTNYFDALYNAVIAKVDYDKSLGLLTH
ncbi:MAG TPA: TolC family protein [Bacteroidia bacterium]|jgi:outer membrane protein TolC|nr:TolC family protein [Bacteroidia bacterium]